MIFISFRIARKSYTIFKMSPHTATSIMKAIDVTKEPDNSQACIAAMARSIALAIAGSRNIFSGIRMRLLQRRFMKKASFEEMFDAYHKTLLMIPLEDIAAVAGIMEQLSTTVSKDNE